MKFLSVVLTMLVGVVGSHGCGLRVENEKVLPSAPSICGAHHAPHLVISTAHGSIEIELFESAAPEAVRRIVELARKGAYDGLTFNYTKPHFEIIVAPVAPDLEIEKEIDAVALGLDEMVIEDAGEAMDVFQFELFPAFAENKKEPLTPRLGEWVRIWEETGSAAFLVGRSWQEINEALGYVYTPGLDSRPVLEGGVTLKPVSRRHSTARLSISLSDQPRRTGRHVVIGQVRQGLQLADDISIRPLAVPPGHRSYDFRPQDPVTLQSVRVECRRETETEETPPTTEEMDR